MIETQVPHRIHQKIRTQPSGHKNTSHIAYPITYSQSVNGRQKNMDRDRVRQDEDVNPSRIPVFVFPSTVYFNAQERDKLKQPLTIYNPYEFPIRFKVLSTAPNLYTVIDPEGQIRAKNSVQLILRVSIIVPFDTTSPLEHKFRVKIYHQHERNVLGQRDVQSIIHFGNLPPHLLAGSDTSQGTISSTEAFEQCPPGASAMSSGNTRSRDHPITSSNIGGSSIGFIPAAQQPNYVVILTALVCIVGLMLPISSESCISGGGSTSAQETSSFIPSYLHLTVNQKLLFAFTLGLVTMVILRP